MTTVHDYPTLMLPVLRQFAEGAPNVWPVCRH